MAPIANSDRWRKVCPSYSQSFERDPRDTFECSRITGSADKEPVIVKDNAFVQRSLMADDEESDISC